MPRWPVPVTMSFPAGTGRVVAAGCAFCALTRVIDRPSDLTKEPAPTLPGVPYRCRKAFRHHTQWNAHGVLRSQDFMRCRSGGVAMSLGLLKTSLVTGVGGLQGRTPQ
jgi:hypothetical protein